jgi:hypothetical protein
MFFRNKECKHMPHHFMGREQELATLNDLFSKDARCFMVIKNHIRGCYP